MHGDDQVSGREGRRRSRLRLLFGLVPVALIVAGLMPAAASADPKFDNGCRAQLTGEEGADEAELTFRCADFEVTGQDAVQIQGNKQFIVVPLAEGPFVCVPLQQPGTSATCGTPGADAGTFRILAQDACGTEDNRPLVLDVLLVGEEPQTQTADIEELQIQCEEEPPDDGNGDGDGPGGGGEDDGATPQGGVQSGGGGTAGGGGPDALLPVGLGLILLGALGFGALTLARRRT
jgi:hypothetical protein